MASEIMLFLPLRLGRKAAKKMARLAWRMSEKTALKSGGTTSFLVVALVLGEYQHVTLVPSASASTVGTLASAVRIGCPWEFLVPAPAGSGSSKSCVSVSSRC